MRTVVKHITGNREGKKTRVKERKNEISTVNSDV